MKFFTSDLHCGHKKIAKERGFDTSNIEWLDGMNSTIIKSINNSVREDDELFILGDLSFMKPDETLEIIKSINCKNLYLIRGNHDGEKTLKKIEDQFIWIKDYYKLKIKDEDVNGGNQHLVLFHYPMLTWDRAHYGSWQLHGHCHGSLDSKYQSTRIDIGWDVWRRVITYEDIKRNMLNKTYTIVDHHFPGSED
jgi:calcineurin-like phosphoesterase family protein